MRSFRVVAAPNAFKGTLDAVAAARALAEGVRRACPDCTVDEIPLSDGGDGFLRVTAALAGGTCVSVPVHDPLDRPVEAPFCLLPRKGGAVVESALAAGISLLKPEERNPLEASTRGVGELIRHALDRGITSMRVGVGGTATVDGGCGMAQALGIRFLDRRGRALPRLCGGVLGRIARIRMAGRDPRLEGCSVEGAVDVENPLLGPEGAARVYAPQKGAGPEDTARLEEGLARLAEVIRNDLGIDADSPPGAGAGGGLGAGLFAFLGARLRPGFDLLAERARLEARIAASDLVLTGEGRLDRQTFFGKAPARVAALAAARGIPCIALAGSVEVARESLHRHGFMEARALGKAVRRAGAGEADTGEALRAAATEVARRFFKGGPLP